jgi:hypothetical protein
MPRKKRKPEISAQTVTQGYLENIIGKTVASCEYGFDKPFHSDAHEGEIIVLHFTDGSSLSIQIGSNAMNLAEKHKRLKARDVHADLIAIFHRQGFDSAIPSSKQIT